MQLFGDMRGRVEVWDDQNVRGCGTCAGLTRWALLCALRVRVWG